MATTSQVRSWWAGYECVTSKYVRVDLPGDVRIWSLLVAGPSKPIWLAVSQIMVAHRYYFLETAGGTYNCRPPSLHAYALALDLNPKRNPYRCPMTTDMPAAFVADMKSIRANGKQALTWGGDWPCTNPPDPMHYQLNVAPSDCKNVTWGDMADPKVPVEPWARSAYQWAISTRPTQVYKADSVNEIRETVDDQREMVFLWRAVTNVEGQETGGHNHDGRYLTDVQGVK